MTLLATATLRDLRAKRQVGNLETASLFGHSPYNTNTNVVLGTTDLGKARRVAKAVRVLPGVESLALEHGGAIEVACNLLRPEEAGPEELLRVVRESAEAEGCEVREWYSIPPTVEEIFAGVGVAGSASSK